MLTPEQRYKAIKVLSQKEAVRLSGTYIDMIPGHVHLLMYGFKGYASLNDNALLKELMKYRGDWEVEQILNEHADDIILR